VRTAPPSSLSALRPAAGGLSPLQRVLGWGPLAVGQIREMRHAQPRGRLNRSPKKRWALLRNLVTELVRHERILTTLARAKELRKIADWVVTMGKQGTLFSRRRAQAVFRTDEALHKTFTVLALRYKDRVGGYTRVLRHRLNRKGDNAPMAFIEYVDRPGELRDPKPPVERLPYSKRIASAEHKGDAELAEYFKERQQEVVAATQRKVQRQKQFVVTKGKYAREDLLEEPLPFERAESAGASASAQQQ